MHSYLSPWFTPEVTWKQYLMQEDSWLSHLSNVLDMTFWGLRLQQWILTNEGRTRLLNTQLLQASVEQFWDMLHVISLKVSGGWGSGGAKAAHDGCTSHQLPSFPCLTVPTFFIQTLSYHLPNDYLHPNLGFSVRSWMNPSKAMIIKISAAPGSSLLWDFSMHPGGKSWAGGPTVLCSRTTPWFWSLTCYLQLCFPISASWGLQVSPCISIFGGP